MNFSPSVYIIACFVFILLCIIFAKPLKSLFKVIVNSALGCAAIMIFNFVGGIFGAYIGVNAFTSLVVGLLGIPGFLTLLVLQFLLK